MLFVLFFSFLFCPCLFALVPCFSFILEQQGKKKEKKTRQNRTKQKKEKKSKMSFQKTVLIIAGIVLVITLIGVGMLLRSHPTNQTWPPPTAAPCPDYWIDGSPVGDGTKCYNNRGLGKCTKPGVPVNFSIMDLCTKYQYAKKCGITWTGITEGNPCA